jgi:hypothetical protein
MRVAVARALEAGRRRAHVSLVVAVAAITGSLAVGWLARAAIDGGRTWGTIPYRGHLELDGAPQDAPVDLAFSLWNAPSGGNKLWEETQLGVMVKAGSFSVRLGSATILNQAVERAQDLYLAVEARPAGGSTFEPLSGRQALGGVPFALGAKRGIPGQPFEADGLSVNGDTTVSGTIAGNKLTTAEVDVSGAARLVGSLALVNGSEVAGGELVGDAQGMATWRRPPSNTRTSMTAGTQYLNATGRRLQVTVIVGAVCVANRGTQIWIAPNNGGAPGVWENIAFETGQCDAFTINGIVPVGYYYRYEAINGANVLSAGAMEI